MNFWIIIVREGRFNDDFHCSLSIIISLQYIEIINTNEMLLAWFNFIVENVKFK